METEAHEACMTDTPQGCGWRRRIGAPKMIIFFCGAVEFLAQVHAIQLKSTNLFPVLPASLGLLNPRAGIWHFLCCSRHWALVLRAEGGWDFDFWFRGAKQRAPGPSPFNRHNPIHGALGKGGESGLYPTPTCTGPVCHLKRARTRRARALGLASTQAEPTAPSGAGWRPAGPAGQPKAPPAGTPMPARSAIYLIKKAV